MTCWYNANQKNLKNTKTSVYSFMIQLNKKLFSHHDTAIKYGNFVSKGHKKLQSADFYRFFSILRTYHCIKQNPVKKYQFLYVYISVQVCFRQQTVVESLKEKPESGTRSLSGCLVSQISPALSAVLNSSTAEHESGYTLHSHHCTVNSCRLSLSVALCIHTYSCRSWITSSPLSNLHTVCPAYHHILPANMWCSVTVIVLLTLCFTLHRHSSKLWHKLFTYLPV